MNPEAEEIYSWWPKKGGGVILQANAGLGSGQAIGLPREWFEGLHAIAFFQQHVDGYGAKWQSRDTPLPANQGSRRASLISAIFSALRHCAREERRATGNPADLSAVAACVRDDFAFYAGNAAAKPRAVAVLRCEEPNTPGFASRDGLILTGGCADIPGYPHIPLLEAFILLPLGFMRHALGVFLGPEWGWQFPR